MLLGLKIYNPIGRVTVVPYEQERWWGIELTGFFRVELFEVETNEQLENVHTV